MSNLEFDWGQPPVGEDIYFSDRSIGGSGLMQSVSRVRGTRHRGYGTRSRSGELLQKPRDHTTYRVLFSGGIRPSAMARRRLNVHA